MPRQPITLKNRIVHMEVYPMAGDEISELKAAVKEFAVAYGCKIKFSHNADWFICDAEGNVAKTN